MLLSNNQQHTFKTINKNNNNKYLYFNFYLFALFLSNYENQIKANPSYITTPTLKGFVLFE